MKRRGSVGSAQRAALTSTLSQLLLESEIRPRLHQPAARSDSLMTQSSAPLNARHAAAVNLCQEKLNEPQHAFVNFFASDCVSPKATYSPVLHVCMFLCMALHFCTIISS